MMNQEALKIFMETQRSDLSTASTLPLLNQFKKFPETTDIMILYFNEFLRCTDNKLRLAPSILLGALSELIVITLVQEIGRFLEDPNAITSYKEKRGNSRKDYVITLLQKTKERVQQKRPLQLEEERCFREAIGILELMFDSIRLNRNEYAHPEPSMSISELSEPEVFITHASAFNTYAKALLHLVYLVEHV